MTTDAQELDLKPPFVALEWYKGTTVPFTVTATNSAGTAVNLTGATAVMVVKDASNATVMTLQTGGSGIVLTTPLSGVMTISPEAVGTNSLQSDSTYYTDLIVTLSDSTVYPFFSGIITLSERLPG